MNFAPSASEALSAKINGLIDAALEKENAARPKRDYLGASRIGEECMRRLGYEYHHTPGDAFPGHAIRRFRMGHMHEDEIVDWLIKAKFDLRVKKPDGDQYGFGLAPHPETGRPRFAGHTDGIIVGGPDVGVIWPALWENKIMKAEIWRATLRHGVRQEHFIYFAQTQIYMRQFALAHCLFTALNTDTSELLFELIPFDAALAETLIDKAAMIIESRHPEELPRVAREETDYRCKFCPFRNVCWSKPVTPAARPTWLRAS
jgi:hypothetical protein